MTIAPKNILRDEDLAWAGNNLTNACYGIAYNAGWHHDLETGELIKHNVGQRLMLIVTELAEAMEGYRKNLPSDHLPNRTMFEEELADAAIRIFDTAGEHGIKLGDVITEKLKYNQKREDHKREHRLSTHGKKV